MQETQFHMRATKEIFVFSEQIKNLLKLNLIGLITK